MTILNRVLGVCALLTLAGSATAQDIITVPPPPNSGNSGANNEFTLPPPVNPTGPGPVITSFDLTPPDVTGVNPQGGQNGNNTGFVPPDLLSTPPGTNTYTPPAPQVDPLDIDTGSLPLDLPPANTDNTPATNTDNTTATDGTPATTPPVTGTQPGTPADTGGHPQWPSNPGGTHVPTGQHPDVSTPGDVRNNAANTTNSLLRPRPQHSNTQTYTTPRGFDQEHYAVSNSINNIRNFANQDAEDEELKPTLIGEDGVPYYGPIQNGLNDNAGALTLDGKFADEFDPLLHWKHPTRRPCDMWSTIETGAMLKAWLNRFGGKDYKGREPSWTYVNGSNIKDGMRVQLNRMSLYIECAGNTLQLVTVDGKTTTVVFADLREPGQTPEIEIGDIPQGGNLGPAITNELRTRDEFDKAKQERRDQRAENEAEEDTADAPDLRSDAIVEEPLVDAGEIDDQGGDEPLADASDEANVIDEIMADGERILDLREKRKELEEELKVRMNQPGDGYTETQAKLDEVNAQLDELTAESDPVDDANDESDFSYDYSYDADSAGADETPVVTALPEKDPVSQEHQAAMDARDRDPSVPPGKIYYDAYEAPKSPKEFEELSDDMKWYYASEEGIAIRNLARDEKLEQDLAAIQAEQDAADAKIAARKKWEQMQAERAAEIDAFDKQFNALQLELDQAVRDGDTDKQRAIENEFDELHDNSLDVYEPLTWEQAQMNSGEDDRIRARNEQHLDNAFQAVKDQLQEKKRADDARALQTRHALLGPAYFMAGVGKACWTAIYEPFLIAGDTINSWRYDHDTTSSGLFKMAEENDGAFEMSYAYASAIVGTVPAWLNAMKEADCVAIGETTTNLAFLIVGGYSVYKTAPKIHAAAKRMGLQINRKTAQFIETIGRWREAKANGTMTRALDAAYQAEVRSIVKEGVEHFRTSHNPEKPWTEADYVAFEEAMYDAYLHAELLDDHTIWGKVYREFKPYEPRFPRDGETATGLHAADNIDALEKTDVMRPGGNPKRLGNEPNPTVDPNIPEGYQPSYPRDAETVADLRLADPDSPPYPLDVYPDRRFDGKNPADMAALDELSRRSTEWILAERERQRLKLEAERKARELGWGDWGEETKTRQ